MLAAFGLVLSAVIGPLPCSFRNLIECRGQSIDRGAAMKLGHRNQHVLLQMRVVLPEVISADDAELLAQAAVDFCDRPRKANDEFLEERQLRRLRIDREAI